MAEKPRRTNKAARSTPKATNENDLIKFVRDEIKNDISHLEDKVDTKCQTLEGRIDALDESIRGNGRIGYSEQIRNMKRTIWILITAIIWLGGFELGGVTLKNWLDDFLHPDNIEYQENNFDIDVNRPSETDDKTGEGTEIKTDEAEPEMMPLRFCPHSTDSESQSQLP